jgi:formylglycine-generating enzyme required for sulfatase activity
LAALQKVVDRSRELEKASRQGVQPDVPPGLAEARAAATEAWEQVKGIDRSEGFGDKLDEVIALRTDVDGYRNQKAGTKELEALKKVIDKSQKLQQQDKQRQQDKVTRAQLQASQARRHAEQARAEADTARKRAEQAKAKMAGVRWTEALRKDKEAQQAFTSGDMVRAVLLWQEARQGYAEAQEAAGEIRNSIGMRLVRIREGTFQMGSPKDEPDRSNDEGPQHQVKISKTFYMGIFEVTQEQYERVMKNKHPSYFSAGGDGRAAVKAFESTKNFPVDSVSYTEAMEFCARLSRLPEEQAAGRRYDLPTEAEWEYACRARTATPFHFGPHLDDTQANCKPAALGRTCPVGSYPPNAWGLYDMHGNVLEWCKDWYDAEYYKPAESTDPQGPPEAVSVDRRVVRGGSWDLAPEFCRAAFRLKYQPADRSEKLGFRVVLRVD